MNGLKCSRENIEFGEAGGVFNYIACFTDIPLRECNEHTSIYGKFGIGFKKSFIKNHGGNPARYYVDSYPILMNNNEFLNPRGLVNYSLTEHVKITKKISDSMSENPKVVLENGTDLISSQELRKWIKSQIKLLSFEKGIGDLGVARDDTDNIDVYYKEREWRLIADERLLNSHHLEGEIENSEFYFKFSRNDINMIVVPNNEIRIAVGKHLEQFKDSDDARLREFSENPISILNYDDLHKW